MCVSPILVRLPASVASRLCGAFQYVPCGKCSECLANYQNSWKIRLSEESHNWRYMVFMTLTYRDECAHVSEVSINGHTLLSVCKSDVQNWIKRFRENYYIENGERLKLKYFLTSEYGPKTFRPHYHIICYTNDISWVIPAKLDWSERFGFAITGSKKNGFKLFYDLASYDSFKDNIAGRLSNYVSKYCSKGKFENPYINESKGLLKTFHLISKNIGLSWLDSERCNQLRTYLLEQQSKISKAIRKSGQNYYKLAFSLTCSDTQFHGCDDIHSAADFLLDYVSHNWLELAKLSDKLKYSSYDITSKKVHFYKLPRYYGDRLFRLRASYARKCCKFNEEGQLEIVEKSDIRFRQSLLSLALSYAVQLRSIFEEQSTIAGICENTDKDMFLAQSELYEARLCNLSERRRVSDNKQKQFYSKSQF